MIDLDPKALDCEELRDLKDVILRLRERVAARRSSPESLSEYSKLDDYLKEIEAELKKRCGGP
jgi:hypothetical protein